jgi:hypothetical protein
MPPAPESRFPQRSGEAAHGSAPARLVEGLGPTEQEALRLIAAGDSRAYHAWAGKNKIMGELMSDRINDKFRELSGDLLIETTDEGLAIHSEYRAELQGILFGRP